MPPTSGPGREPRREMTAEAAVDLVDLLEGAGLDVWLHGGWAVDAVLATQTRPHDDLDLLVELRVVETVREALAQRGYAVARGAPPASFEMTDRAGRQVDVHSVVFTRSGDGLERTEDGEDWVFPAVGFAGAGYVLGRRVRCLTPEVQMLCHTGYAPHRTSFEDVTALSKRFGIPVPDEYRGAPETYPRRAT